MLVVPDQTLPPPPPPPPREKTKKSSKTSATVIVPLASLGPIVAHIPPKHYGTHGETVWIEKGPLTIVAIDPGHATLVDVVRYHPEGVLIEPLPTDASRIGARNAATISKIN